MDKLAELYQLLDGKKTYIVAFLTALFALLAAFGVVVPEWVYIILGAVGLGAVRAGIAKR